MSCCEAWSSIRVAQRGGVEHEVDAGPDGELAGLLASGHAPHPIGDDHPVGHFVHIIGHLARRHVGRDDIERPAHPADQEVVLVIRADLARV